MENTSLKSFQYVCASAQYREGKWSGGTSATEEKRFERNFAQDEMSHMD